jgi:hypothetical protein
MGRRLPLLAWRHQTLADLETLPQRLEGVMLVQEADLEMLPRRLEEVMLVQAVEEWGREWRPHSFSKSKRSRMQGLWRLRLRILTRLHFELMVCF